MSLKTTPSADPQAEIPVKRRRLHYLENRQTIRSNERARLAKRTPSEKLETAWRRYSNPPIPRDGSKNSKVPRKVTVSNARVSWNDIGECFRIYMAAAVMSELFEKRYVVDHVVPLKHALVCGIHSHNNLNVISSEENALKGNIYWPNMPEVTWATLDFLVENAQYSMNLGPKLARKREKTYENP